MHPVFASAPWDELEWIGHWMVVVPPVQYRPGGQGLHVSAVAPTKPGLQIQASWLVDLAGAYELMGQDEMVLPPGQNEPAGHGKHGALPVSLYHSGAHVQPDTLAVPGFEIVWIGHMFGGSNENPLQ